VLQQTHQKVSPEKQSIINNLNVRYQHDEEKINEISQAHRQEHKVEKEEIIHKHS
jgi:hypothetical protein